MYSRQIFHLGIVISRRLVSKLLKSLTPILKLFNGFENHSYNDLRVIIYLIIFMQLFSDPQAKQKSYKLKKKHVGMFNINISMFHIHP